MTQLLSLSAIPMNRLQIDALAEAVQSGDRSALARAITLVESSLDQDRYDAELLLGQLLPVVGHSIRIGITGIPGAGKSTLIERLGIQALDSGHKVAVLTVDPSSEKSGGSILGDKTRMTLLATKPQAFVRPSPAGVNRGGIAERTRECVYLCEAAGFDLVIVETIGVGQVELSVAGITDIVVLLLLPSAGDELQGMKRGAIELADVVLINKADGLMRNVALATVADYRQALRLTRQSRFGEVVEVIAVSALEDQGTAEVLQKLFRLHQQRQESGALAVRRAEQCRDWLWQAIREIFLESMAAKTSPQDRIAELEQEVVAGRMTASMAARQFVSESTGHRTGEVA
jgi:LAO/AO transport system kinase